MKEGDGAPTSFGTRFPGNGRVLDPAYGLRPGRTSDREQEPSSVVVRQGPANGGTGHEPRLHRDGLLEPSGK